MARKILLADDSVTAQNMGRRILTDAGYEVTTVNNGSAALKKIAEQKPDLMVLDVYMPGYGGLEVCQRVKENKETARIPVLLTVGKLEPFKPEEARRVRADAFIVKPFEASELLTALTKLEDKIVPQAGPYKPGRFAKAIAAVEESELGERFGDSETGWKNRLIIPSPGDKSKEDKPKESEAEVPPATNTAFRDLARGEDFKPAELKSEFERPIPAGLPPDITPEEIAAITAAAAAVGGKATGAPPQPVTAEAKPEAVAKTELAKAEAAVSDATGEGPVATIASAAQVQSESTTETKTETTPEAAPAAAQVEPAAVPEAVASSSESSAAKVGTDSEAKPASPVNALEMEKKRAVSDPEVLAALASLGIPSNGDAGSIAQASDTSGKTWQEASTPTTAAVAKAELAAVGAGASGPRWIAEAMPVPDSESTLMLEQEMEKAYAAFAAADAARAGLAAWSSTLDTFRAPSAEPASSTIESSSIASTSVAESKSEAPAPPVAVVPEPVANAVPEPPVTAVAAAVASTTEAAPTAEMIAPAPISDAAVPVAEEKAAYAAAASAGSSAAEPTTTSEPASRAAVTGESSESVPAAGGERHREAELAAAWENWRQIRESAPGPQPTSQTPDAATSGFKDIRKEDPSPAQPEAEAASAAASDSTEISSIVDNMLAELKPKLMEEIAKKMGNEKKKEKKSRK